MELLKNKEEWDLVACTSNLIFKYSSKGFTGLLSNIILSFKQCRCQKNMAINYSIILRFHLPATANFPPIGSCWKSESSSVLTADPSFRICNNIFRHSFRKAEGFCPNWKLAMPGRPMTWWGSDNGTDFFSVALSHYITCLSRGQHLCCHLHWFCWSVCWGRFKLSTRWCITF